MIDERLDYWVLRRLVGCRRSEAGYLNVLERDNRLDDILGVERGLLPSLNERLGDSEEVVEEEQEAILGSLQ